MIAFNDTPTGSKGDEGREGLKNLSVKDGLEPRIGRSTYTVGD